VGTIISLDIAGMGLDWSKNSKGVDHGALFQEQDRMRVRSDQISYEYYDGKDEELAPNEMAFVRCLKDVLPRLALLGFTRERAVREYENLVETCLDEASSESDDDGVQPPTFVSFDEFCAFVAKHPIAGLDDTFVESLDREKIKGRFACDEIAERIPHSWTSETDAYSERSYFGGLIGILHPYSLMWMLGEGEQNRESDVVWQYGPLVESGWADAAEFTPCARRTETFLVATEGSSDAHILKHAFSILRPEVADFFRFIDVSERHPFPGTGNLVKFAEGLAKIDVHNQVVFLFDNDGEGYEAYERVQRLSLPANLRAIMLPELEEFRAFPARGPEGVNRADINRRAAAIECYLDLGRNGRTPQVVWTNYKKDLDDYHGALEHKEDYAKAFLKQTPEAIASGAYDARKIRIALDALVAECSSIATQGGLAAL
jgi:hypothetical protein